MKIKAATVVALSKGERIVEFLRSNSDEVFLAGELSEKSGMKRASEFVAKENRFVMANGKIWYGIPSAIKAFQKALKESE